MPTRCSRGCLAYSSMVGIGALLSATDLAAFGGVPYVHWLGPGLLAAMAMNTTRNRATSGSTAPRREFGAQRGLIAEA